MIKKINLMANLQDCNGPFLSDWLENILITGLKICEKNYPGHSSCNLGEPVKLIYDESHDEVKIIATQRILLEWSRS